MKTSTTSERIQQLMIERHLKQVDILDLAKPFCEKHGVNLGKSALSQYISGVTEPGQRKLSILSMALNVSEAWLMGYDVPECRVPNITNLTPFPQDLPLTPLIGSIACGTPITAEQNVDDYMLTPEGVTCDFCLRCKGDSMIGDRIMDGDIVYIRAQPDVENGQVAAVIIDDEATLKHVYHQPASIMLTASNPAYPPILCPLDGSTPVRILGLAVSFTSKVL